MQEPFYLRSPRRPKRSARPTTVLASCNGLRPSSATRRPANPVHKWSDVKAEKAARNNAEPGQRRAVLPPEVYDALSRDHDSYPYMRDDAQTVADGLRLDLSKYGRGPSPVMCESCETRPASTWCSGCLIEDHQACEIARGEGSQTPECPSWVLEIIADFAARWPSKASMFSALRKALSAKRERK